MVSDHTHLFVLVTDPVMRFLDVPKNIWIMSRITPAIFGKVRFSSFTILNPSKSKAMAIGPFSAASLY